MAAIIVTALGSFALGFAACFIVLVKALNDESVTFDEIDREPWVLNFEREVQRRKSRRA